MPFAVLIGAGMPRVSGDEQADGGGFQRHGEVKRPGIAGHQHLQIGDRRQQLR